MPSEKEYLDFLETAGTKKMISVDTETTGLKVQEGEHYAMGLSISFKQETRYRAMYFPFRHPGEGNVSHAVRIKVKEVIESAPFITYHHAKFDIPSLATLGIHHEGPFYCTLLMSHLINENRPYDKKLDTLCRYYLGPGMHKQMHPTLAAWIKTFGWGSVTAQAMYSYATQDAYITLPLGEVLFPKMYKETGNSLETWNHKQKLVRVLIKMKDAGVRVDAAKCREMVTLADKEMARLIKSIGFKPTPNSLIDYFIKELKLPVLHWTKWNKKSKTPEYEFVPKPSFTKAALDDYEILLERIAPGNTKVRDILAYRGWQKARSSFYQSWLDHMCSDGRIRPNYIMHKDPDDGGTVTGRLSCKEPNLQQIPRITDKPWNKDVKPCLIPRDGYVLVEADYSQLELRLSTAYAREASLIRVFNEGRDIFSEMAERLRMSRDDTKTFVYSTQYGAGIDRISFVFGISKEEADGIRQNYFGEYPGFRAFAIETSGKVKSTGRIRIWTGRYRHFSNPKEEAHKAMNACIQGGAADIVERIMVKCDETFVDWDECKMLLQIHDALIFEIKKDKMEKYLPLIKNTMENVDAISPEPFGVKFAVDVHMWGSKESLI